VPLIFVIYAYSTTVYCMIISDILLYQEKFISV